MNMRKVLAATGVAAVAWTTFGANNWTGGSHADMADLANWNNQGVSPTAVKNQIRAFTEPVSGIYLGSDFTVNALYNYARGLVSLDLEKESAGEKRTLTLVGRTSTDMPYQLAYTANNTGADASTMEFLSGTIECQTNIYVAANSENLANKTLRISGTEGRHATLDMKGNSIAFGSNEKIRNSRLEILNGGVVTNTAFDGSACGFGTIVVDSSSLHLKGQLSFAQPNNQLILQGRSPKLTRTNNLVLGHGSATTNNLFAVRATGTVDLARLAGCPLDIYVGAAGGHDNRFEISGGDATVMMSLVRIGSGGPSNRAAWTGSNQVINLSSTLTVGYGNSAVSNRLEMALTNSTVTCGNFYVGYLTNAFNEVVIAGSNLTMTAGGDNFSIGEYGSTNTLVVSGPDVVLEVPVLRPGRRDTADANTVIIRDGARLQCQPGATFVGVNGTHTCLTVDGGMLDCADGNLHIGYDAHSRDSAVLVCGAGVVRARYVRAGNNGGLGAALAVSNGVVQTEHLTFPASAAPAGTTTGHRIELAGTNAQIVTTGNVGIRSDTVVRFAPELGCEKQPYFDIAGNLIIEADARIEVDPAAVTRYARSGAGTMTLFTCRGTFTVPEAKIDA